MKKKILIVVSILTFIIGISITLAFLSPSCKKYISLAMFHLMGNTGTIEIIANDGYKDQKHYTWGKRNGIWKTWDKNGKLVSQCEYKNGEPWNGLCYIYESKNWIAEYKDGKPWNGAFSSFTKNEKGDCYINGKEVSLADFKQYYNIPENYLAVGIQKFNLK